MFESLLASNTTARKPKRWLHENECEINIKILNLVDNDHMEESLKHVLALLYANQSIVVDIDTPKSLMPKAGADEKKKTLEGDKQGSLGTIPGITNGEEAVVINKKN